MKKLFSFLLLLGLFYQFAESSGVSCDDSDPWNIGSELIRVNDVSAFDDTAETLTVEIEWPQKYTINGLTFLDGNGNLDYTTAETNGWTVGTDSEDACVSTLTKTFDWADAAAGGVSLLLNDGDDPPTYTFFIRVEAVEEFVKTDSLGVERDETRTLLLDLPLKLELEDEIELTTDFSVVINDAVLFDIIEYVAIASTNILEKASVTITYTTIMNYPWRLDENSFNITDSADVIFQEEDAVLTLESEDCDDVGADAECTQKWEIVFNSTDMCGAQGWIDINMNAVYNDFSQSVPVEMLLSLGKGTYFDCANVLGTVGLEGEIHVHDEDNKYTTAEDTTLFYLEDLAYFTATFTSVGPINDISITNVDITQDGVTACTDCTSDAEFELTVEDEGTIEGGASSNYIHFYLNLAGQYLIGSTTGGINTKIMITFEMDFAETPASGSRRRLLTITAGDAEANTDAEQIELSSTINILTSSCGDGIKRGEVKKTPCSEHNVHIEMCEAEGWRTLVNQCGDDFVLSEENNVAMGEDMSEASPTSGMSNYLIASLILVGIIASGGLYVFYRSKKKTSYMIQSEKQLNSVTIGETKESHI